MRVVIINGPNLNALGRREIDIYGRDSMEQIILSIQREHMDLHLEYHQSNHEGVLIDWIQALNHIIEHPAIDNHLEDPIGIVLNAGGYTHTSVSLRDAIAMSKIPIVEVHISNILTRESFRQNSLLTDVCQHTIMGIGNQCYQEAVNYLICRNKE